MNLENLTLLKIITVFVSNYLENVWSFTRIICAPIYKDNLAAPLSNRNK